MKKTKLLPVWSLILIDLLLIGALLCTFAYFHHIRILWGAVEDEPIKGNSVFTKPIHNNTLTPPTFQEDDYDYSGDFASSLPQVFLNVGDEIISDDNRYISHDINMTLTEVNTELVYNDKTYTVQYFVYDIYVRNIENLYTVAVNARRPMTELIDLSADVSDTDGNLLKDGPFLAAVNGDYWGNDKHTQVAVRNGVVLRESDYISSDICVLYYDGTMETITPQNYDWEKISANAPYQIWEFGPSLLDQFGNALDEFSNESYDHNVVDQRHPRCAIGYFEPGHYCFVVVDGRSDDSQGVRMFQLAEIFESLGCKAAYNFDGGDSCQAYWGDQVIRESATREDDDQRDLFDIVGVGEVLK